MASRTLSAFVAIVASWGAASAWAQSAGSIVGRIGATQISPQVTSGDLSSPSFKGTKVDVKGNTQPTGGLTWMWTDAIAVDVPLAAGFKHDLLGAGAIAGVGKIGDVHALPATVMVQYRFLGAGSMVRPYVGLGPTYAYFYDSRSTAALTALTGGTPTTPTTISVGSKWTYTAQLGLSVQFGAKWSLDAAAMKTPLKVRTRLSTGQTLDATLDPNSVSVGVGYKF